MRAIWAAVWIGASGGVMASPTEPAWPQGLRPMQIGLRVACLGCDAETMAGVARGIGPGTHLVVDARGKVGRKYGVVCAGHSGPPPGLAQMPQPCVSPTIATELPLDEVERRYLKGFMPYMGGGGQLRAQIRVDWTAHSSVYRLGGSRSHLVGDFRKRFWETLWSQNPELSAEPLAWLQQWLPMNTSSELVTRVVFPDRSQIVVNVNLRSLFNSFGTVSIDWMPMELDPVTAKDGDGQPVLGWELIAPNEIGPFEVERRPSNAVDFEFLMGQLGFRILPEPGGKPGERYRCLVREEVGKSGKPYEASVCLRGALADQYSAPPPSR